MNTTIIKKINSQIDEKYIKIIHRSGLTVYIVHKDMSTSSVILAAKCGSLDNAFTYKDSKGNTKSVMFPEGIAHFVEHKLFANPDGVDTSEKLARVGASCNAYTSLDKTAYIFSTRDNLNQALRILLKSYFTPYFTQGNVRKERLIISEEIKMYNDDPADSLFFSMMDSMFSHPYMNTSGCGTLKSISHITPEMLQLYHSCFYHPENSVLCICGKADPDEVVSILDREVPELPPYTVKKISFPERNGVIRNQVSIPKKIACPIVNVGIKLNVEHSSPEERMKYLVAVNILCEHYFSSSNPFISDFYENGEVSCEIKYGLDIAWDRGCITLYTETRQHKAVLKKLRKYINSIVKSEMTEKRLETIKKVLYSSFLAAFDNTAEVANELLNFDCDNFDILSFPEVISSIDINFVNTIAKSIFLDYNVCEAVYGK